jgi:predicted ribosome quality control (RQC) complex YloA/Tae2 family protein
MKVKIVCWRVISGAETMRAMENLEYSFIAKELKTAEGKHFSNAYRIVEGKYRMKIGDMHIVLEAGKRLNIAKYVEEAKEADKIVLFLKKILDNVKLKEVKQHSGDRVVIFEFECRDSPALLVFEGFGDGNIILVKEGNTVAAMREEEWSDREIRAGKPYSLPKSKIVEKLEDALSDRYVVTSLMKLPLGKEYAKEILQNCGIDEKKAGNALTDAEITLLKQEIGKLADGAAPYGFYEAGKITDYGLMKFSRYAKLEARPFPTLSEAADEFYFNVKETGRNEKLDKLKRRLEEQENRLESLKKDALDAKAQTDFLYVNYDKVEAILQKAKGLSMDEVEKEFERAKLNKKKKEIELEL